MDFEALKSGNSRSGRDPVTAAARREFRKRNPMRELEQDIGLNESLNGSRLMPAVMTAHIRLLGDGSCFGDGPVSNPGTRMMLSTDNSKTLKSENAQAQAVRLLPRKHWIEGSKLDPINIFRE